ncbi:hypothetical protein L3X38_005495 [Prunus dulcis]|uniref:Uncharacterized protein n=1 Tax=Prunus dulcis TaxID=3755 RepID=A0AAD4ZR40_PRUDU|nr:hypothetical protein L3X38_005495 [Prunus dulcis]
MEVEDFEVHHEKDSLDFYEEGTKRKGRRITGSDNVKEEGRERKTRRISVVDDVEEEGTTNRKRRRSVVSDNVKEEGTKRKSSGSESESCSVCMEMTKKKSRLIVPWFL